MVCRQEPRYQKSCVTSSVYVTSCLWGLFFGLRPDYRNVELSFKIVTKLSKCWSYPNCRTSIPYTKILMLLPSLLVIMLQCVFMLNLVELYQFVKNLYLENKNSTKHAMFYLQEVLTLTSTEQTTLKTLKKNRWMPHRV